MLIDKGAAIAAIKKLEIDGPQMIWSSDAIDAVQGVEYVDDGRWISVKDRLPEKRDTNSKDYDVLLFIPKRDGCRQHGIYLGFLREEPSPPDDGSGNFWGVPCPGSEWTVWDWSYFEEPIVTHWMPRPEPPKEGE